ncbi:MAG: CRISPR-associated endonuclease Cas3'' [Verrucomicrobia bacterium]|nr:CRISPR-associated endonuclease Cas3'' [Verrucomicrobiota bacterium]
MNATQLLAHPDQSLVKHLLGVARRAKEFAARFQGENHAELAGLLHDLGKAEKEFQDRIAGKKADTPSSRRPPPVAFWRPSS